MNDPNYSEMLETIEELDSIGRNEFLKKHNFGENIKYEILHNNKSYPPKALWIRSIERKLIENNEKFDIGWRRRAFGAPQIKKIEEMGFQTRILTDNKKEKWLDSVLKALENLDGAGHLSEIYEEINLIRPSINNHNTWQAQVRATLERNSSDSEAWNGKVDIFSNEDLGSGDWSLKDNYAEQLLDSGIEIDSQLTHQQMIDSYSKLGDKPLSIYQTLYDWGLENLENKSRGKLYFGKNKTGWGTVSFAYKLKNQVLKDINFYLFRISFDGKITTSTWYNTLDNPNQITNKFPFNSSDFQDEFINKLNLIIPNKDFSQVFSKRDNWIEITELKNENFTNEFIELIEWTIGEIEYNYASDSIQINPGNIDNKPIEIKRIKKTEVKKFSTTEVRKFQSKFRKDVLERYGSECSFCEIDNQLIIEAAHLIPYKKVDVYGIDLIQNPKNGLPLCRNHHKLFDQGLIKINPDNLTIEISVLNPESLHVTKHSLSDMVNKPSSECIKWLWSKY